MQDNNNNNEQHPHRQQQQHQNPSPPQRRFRYLELCAVILIFVAFALSAALVLLRHELETKKQRKAQTIAQAALSQLSTSSPDSSDTSSGGDKEQQSTKTSKPFQPHTLDDVHLFVTSSASNHHKNRYHNIGELYWQLARTALTGWDPNLGDESDDDDGSSLSTFDDASSSGLLPWDVASVTALQSLHRAAEMGHAQAQFYSSMAYWSGIWPIAVDPALEATLMMNATSNSSSHEIPTNGIRPLEIMSDWWSSPAPPSISSSSSDPQQPKQQQKQQPLRHRSQQQHAQATLWLHMAAMAGHEEAAVAMAYKMEHSLLASSSSSSDPFGSSGASATEASQQCAMKLPYAEAASDLIIDRLQASPHHGRGKVTPPTDKHVLHQLHLLAWSTKFLDAHNQPDESLAALQFYQVRATAPSNSPEGYDPQAPSAAYTLAHLYHTGSRGVPVNVTEALHWYERAANMGHVEAAGQAGDMWLYGIGTPNHRPNPYQAYKWYKKGLPFGVDGCRRKWEQKLSKKDTLVCDATCLNGMGVLLLVGLPMMVSVDMGAAEKYFDLAKEQGKHDAAYNLAMMKLGWKTHWRTRDEAADLEEEEEKERQQDNDPFSTKKNKDSNNKGDGKMFAGMPKYSLTRSEWQSIVTDLAMAAGSGHLQARHRLAKLYANGVQVEVPRSPGQSSTEQLVVIPQDCEKAYKNFKWIMEHGSLHRNRRLRKAFKQYTAGDAEGSLRNYLVAAETGSDLAQLNAAFLLEQGTCLGLSDIDCAKASVRLYKAAAARGHGEASLRVGDFYYYGRFRSDLPSGPFAWLQYSLYPEKYMDKLWDWIYHHKVWNLLYQRYLLAVSDPNGLPSELPNDTSSSQDPQVSVDEPTQSEEEVHTFEHDMQMAAHYYRYAADKAMSLRANFNLGFLYQWGLGLKQDFPLAKRHYDLAIPTGGQVSNLPVTIALHCLVLHEKAVKLYRVVKDWSDELDAANEERQRQRQQQQVPKAAENKEFGRPVPPSAPDTTTTSSVTREQQLEVLLDHLLSLESLLILALTALLWILMQWHQTRQRR